MSSLRKFAALSLLAAGITLAGLGGVASAAAPSDGGVQTMGILCGAPWYAACW